MAPTIAGTATRRRSFSQVVWLYQPFCLKLRDAEGRHGRAKGPRVLRNGTAVAEQVWAGGREGSKTTLRSNGARGISMKCSSRSRVGATTSGVLRPRTAKPWDIFLRSRRNQRIAEQFFRNLLKGPCVSPRQLVTDKLPSVSVARCTTMPCVPHVTARRANNRPEASHHQPTRARER
jgi:hypothetical protein